MKRIIGYVNTADLNHMREEDVRALTVINIAFGLIRDGEVVWDAKDARGWNSIHSEKQPGAEDCIVRRRLGSRRLFPGCKNKRGKRAVCCECTCNCEGSMVWTALTLTGSIRAHRWQELRRTDRIKRIIRCFWRSSEDTGRVQRRHACNDSSRRRCLLCTADRYEPSCI